MKLKLPDRSTRLSNVVKLVVAAAFCVKFVVLTVLLNSTWSVLMIVIASRAEPVAFISFSIVMSPNALVLSTKVWLAPVMLVVVLVSKMMS